MHAVCRPRSYSADSPLAESSVVATVHVFHPNSPLTMKASRRCGALRFAVERGPPDRRQLLMAACAGSAVNETKARPTNWQQRVFGRQLLRCSQAANVTTTESRLCDVGKLLTSENDEPLCETIGVYFSFINPGATCDDFTKQLCELYGSVNGAAKDEDRKKRFEVVHVVLWSNVADVLDFQESFRAHVAELPWLAVPNDDYERKVTNKFGDQQYLTYHGV